MQYRFRFSWHVKVLAEGVSRVNIKKYSDNNEYLEATYSEFKEYLDLKDEPEAMRRTILSHFEQYVKFNKKISSEVFVSVSSIESIDRLVDTIASQISIKIEDGDRRWRPKDNDCGWHRDLG